MASSKIKGITIEIGGDTTKLGKAIADSEKQTRSLQGELKQVEKLLKMDPGNVELVAQKQEILTRAISETTDKLKVLKEAQAQVERQFQSGDIGEDQYRAFQRELIKTETELRDLEDALKDIDKPLDEVGDSAKESSDGFTIMGGALADLVSNAIQGAISAVGDFIGALLELSEATEEYRTMQAKLEGSAKTFGYSTEYAKSKYEEFYKYLGDDQMSTNAITNLMGLGTSTESVSALAEGAISVWSAYGDSIPIEGLTEALNETAQVGKVTGSLADALNWAGISEDEFNAKLEKCKNTQERADLIAQTLNDTYGESKKTYDELNSSVTETNEAELELKETQAQLGEAMTPVNNALSDMKNKALEAITPLVVALAEAFVDLYNWLKENPAVMKALTAVVIALATAFTILAGALAIQGIITGVTKAIAFLNTTLLANPIVLIVALIAGLVAGFIYLWNNCDAFREFWVNLWAKIKEVAGTVKDALVEFFTVTIPNAWENFKTKTGELISAVVDWFKQLPGKISNAIQGAIERVSTWISNVKDKATEGAKNCVNAVVNWFKQLPYKIGYAIGFVIGKLVLWYGNVTKWIKTNVPKIINAVVNFFKQLPGKIWTFLVNTVNRIVTWGKNMKSKATNAVKTLISSVVTFFKQLPGKIWSAIVGAVTRVATWGSNMKSKATTAVKNLVSSVISTMKQLPGKIWSAISGAISKMASWGSQMLSKAKTAVSNVKSSIVDGLKSLPSKVGEIGGNIVEGLWKGIKNSFSWIKSKVKEFAKGILDGMKEALGINSPSKVFADVVGKAIPEGIAKGIGDNSNIADDAVTTLSDDITKEALNINGATINRKLETTFNAGSVTNDNSSLLSKLDSIYEKLGRLQVVLDTGTLVGETIDKIDAGLATRQLLSARGV